MGYPGTDESVDLKEVKELLQALLDEAVETNRLLEALVGLRAYQRPQDTTARSRRCTGSKGSPVPGSIQHWGHNAAGPNHSGQCPTCDRRVRLYTNGMLAVHNHGT